MDSDDIERERGITIYSKNCSVMHNDVKINIVDTPGHAAFSSEVERIIKTVDTVIPLTTDDVSSQKSIQAWVDRVYDQSLAIWRWSIEDYASTIDASPYGDDVAPDDEDEE